MNFSKNLLIEGWREINHSFALINQYQIRELLKNDDFKIYFKDIPFPTPEWNKKNNSSGLKDFEKKIFITIFLLATLVYVVKFLIGFF